MQIILRKFKKNQSLISLNMILVISPSIVVPDVWA